MKKDKIEEAIKHLDESDSWDEVDSVVEIKATKSLDKVIPVRLSSDKWREIRELAKELGIGPTTLARMWILECLANSAPPKIENDSSRQESQESKELDNTYGQLSNMINKWENKLNIIQEIMSFILFDAYASKSGREFESNIKNWQTKETFEKHGLLNEFLFMNNQVSCIVHQDNENAQVSEVTAEWISIMNRNSGMDIEQKDDCIVAWADLPGIQLDTLEINRKGDSLVVTGQRKPPEGVKEKTSQWLQPYGDFHRSVWISQPVDWDNMEFSINNGVLVIRLPRLVGNRKKQTAKGNK